MIYCANCKNCKIAWRKTKQCKPGEIEKRVRCAADQWTAVAQGKRNKDYPYHTVNQRIVDECDHYESMSDDPRESDLHDYLVNLAQNLPGRRVFREAHA